MKDFFTVFFCFLFIAFCTACKKETKKDFTLKKRLKIKLLEDSDSFGDHVATADIDGDKIPDLIVGAPGDNGQGFRRGAVHILFMTKKGTPSRGVTIGDSALKKLGIKLNDSGLFSTYLAIADIDGDRIPDLVVGAPGDSGEGFKRGAVHILFMTKKGTPSRGVTIGDSALKKLGIKLNDSNFFGTHLAIADIDGDKIPDLIVGAPGDNGQGFKRGAVHILFMTKKGTPSKGISIDDSKLKKLGINLKNSESFGKTFTMATDLIVGARGAAYILSY